MECICNNRIGLDIRYSINVIERIHHCSIVSYHIRVSGKRTGKRMTGTYGINVLNSSMQCVGSQGHSQCVSNFVTARIIIRHLNI